MSGPAVQDKAARTDVREVVRRRVGKLRRAQSSSPFGLAEIAGLAASVVIMLAVIFAYFFILMPANSRLAALQSERARLQKQLSSSQADVTRNMDTQAAVERISGSLERFENDQLTGLSQGRTALYSELDGLIRRNGLRNTGGISYVPLESLGAAPSSANGTGSTTPASASGGTAGNAKWQSIYPGIGVRMTIAGQYQNVRRFLRDIETSRKFLVINAVTLESVTETATSPGPGGPTSTRMGRGPSMPGILNTPGRTTVPGNPQAIIESPTPLSQASPRTGLVSLTVDMATYFQRRGGATPAPLDAGTH